MFADPETRASVVLDGSKGGQLGFALFPYATAAGIMDDASGPTCAFVKGAKSLPIVAKTGHKVKAANQPV